MMRVFYYFTNINRNNKWIKTWKKQENKKNKSY
jgi:hypothetical protein